jgi:hypothetical protein
MTLFLTFVRGLHAFLDVYNTLNSILQFKSLLRRVILAVANFWIELGEPMRRRVMLIFNSSFIYCDKVVENFEVNQLGVKTIHD